MQTEVTDKCNQKVARGRGGGGVGVRGVVEGALGRRFQGATRGWRKNILRK